MKNRIAKLMFSMCLLLSLTGCVSDDVPVLINEDELITTVEYRLTNRADDANVVVLKSVDPDGDGPEMPTITTTGKLRVNATYAGSVQFLNESTVPAVDITAEVQEETIDHEVFYATTTMGVQINKLDVDDNGNPLGLLTTFETAGQAAGELLIILRHLPVKPNDGTLSSAGGETDVQVSLPIVVE